MKQYHSICPSPTIKKFHKAIGAWNAIIPDYNTVIHLINNKIYKNVPIKLTEKANSDIKELKEFTI